MIKTFPVLDLPVHLSDNYEELLLDRIDKNQSTHVVTMNSEMAMMAQKNHELATAIRKADLVVPDGSGVILYLKRRGQHQQRIAGIELAEALIERIGKRGETYPICFYGGAPGVSEKATKVWQEKVPSAHIIYNHGYLSGEELANWCQTIKETQPKLILVGLGVPRQELWIMNHRHLAPNALWIGVGGSFDIWSGAKERAPKFFCDNHLEWLYRLYQEPHRWRRMLALPHFFLKAMI